MKLWYRMDTSLVTSLPPGSRDPAGEDGTASGRALGGCESRVGARYRRRHRVHRGSCRVSPRVAAGLLGPVHRASSGAVCHRGSLDISLPRQRARLRLYTPIRGVHVLRHGMEDGGWMGERGGRDWTRRTFIHVHTTHTRHTPHGTRHMAKMHTRGHTHTQNTQSYMLDAFDSHP